MAESDASSVFGAAMEVRGGLLVIGVTRAHTRIRFISGRLLTPPRNLKDVSSVSMLRSRVAAKSCRLLKARTISAASAMGTMLTNSAASGR